MARDIDRALAFMAAAGVDPEAFRTVDLYSSHEALLLDYERALTRIDSRTGLPYDVSGHLVWVGERTRDLDGAHVDFAASVRNPVAVKLGPTTTPDEALALVERLDPDGEPGRLTFISRMGRRPGARRAAARWSRRSRRAARPSRGSATRCTATPSRRRTGCKTRRFDDVIDEVRGFFEVHRALGTHPGGLHMELTGDDVTECLGGVRRHRRDRPADALPDRCDPRLNHAQSLELAFLVAEMLAETFSA